MNPKNQVIICYQDVDVGASQYYGTARVATWSGTSITFPSAAVVFESNSTSDPSATYDTVNNKAIIGYRATYPGGGASWAYARTGSVVGTSITFTDSVLLENSQTEYECTAYDPVSGKTMIGYQDAGDSGKGKAVVFSTDYLETNLTTENYIGIAGESIANSATGKVNVVGGVNSSQSGLTTAKTYYVQGDGTLATTAGSPSVVAGTSISSTKIKVR